MAPPTEVNFELERLAIEGDELVVSGFWTNVRGMRFVRPTLLSDDRRILATLEHKPWAPSDDAPWTAAFPWTGGGAVDAGSLALAVAPRVIVQLGETAGGAPAATAARPAPAAKPAKPAKATAAARPPAAEKSASAVRAAPAAKRPPAAKPAAVAKAARTAQPAAAAPPAPPPAVEHAPAPAPPSNDAPPPAPPIVPVDARSDDLARALAAVERDRDRALAQLAEAVESREAAVRTRARMELAHDEALEAREAAEVALGRAGAERQEAVAQRDEVLIAYRAMQRQLQAEHAQADRTHRGRPEDATDSADGDEPLGVRTVPAVRSVMAELQYPRREAKLRLTQFDLWVVRLLGVAAAGCFFALLFSILRVLL